VRRRRKRTTAGLLAAVIIAVITALLAGRGRISQVSHRAKEVPALSESETYTVATVIDGDTLRLTNGAEVRLVGIDAPDKKDGMFYADEARQFAKQLLEGRQVRVQFDREKRDRYDRFLAYVLYKDGESEKVANIEIVRAGCAYAYSFKPNIAREKEIIAAQKEARQKVLGVWKRRVKKEKEYVVDWGSDFGLTHKAGCERIGGGGRIQKVSTREEGFDMGAPPCRLCQP
jgi:micrococcal nuclease